MSSLLSESHPVFARLRGLHPMPRQLFYEGNPELLERRYISVVGAREPHPWILEWMDQELPPVLLAMNLGVVSGGARGIDQWAHSIALRCGQPTLMVLPSGLARKYPRDVIDFVQQPQVGFLSEYPPETEMRKHHFWRRNLLIAGLTSLTLVIQAAEKSGTMMTALSALSLGKSVAALPASPYDRRMTGNNSLLFSGAAMIRSQSDLLALLLSSPN